MQKRSIITGITGQDGFFLTQLLISKGYEVHGIVRPKSNNDIGTLTFLNSFEKEKVKIHWGEISDNVFITNTIHKIQAHEIYHLAAQSFVGKSFRNPHHTFDTNIQGSLNIVNAIKVFSPSSKLYFAASSEMFGKIQEKYQTETTRFYPRSPYAVSKIAAFWTIVNYREAYNLFMSNGILFNHESEMRGEQFVTRKITLAVARISNNLQDVLELGNIDVQRDWGYAKDYVYGMWLILQHEKPDDFILASGETHSIREFVEKAFIYVGISIRWKGKDLEEVGINEQTGKVCVRINPEFFRPTEVNIVCGDATKAKKQLGWSNKTNFEQIIKIMVEKDLERVT